MSYQKQYGTNVSVNHIAFSNNDCSDDEHDNKVDSINIYDEYSHSEIIDRCDFGRNHLIHARLSSNKSVIQNKVLENRIENNISNSVTTNGGKSTQKNISYHAEAYSWSFERGWG